MKTQAYVNLQVNNRYCGGGRVLHNAVCRWI